ncbi:hypothetical protein DLE01_34020 [Streptomyces sp. FT05W]|nr:hypothetical protein DLE01_34020 [Streptomyces sp. FT05W]
MSLPRPPDRLVRTPVKPPQEEAPCAEVCPSLSPPPRRPRSRPDIPSTAWAPGRGRSPTGSTGSWSAWTRSRSRTSTEPAGTPPAGARELRRVLGGRTTMVTAGQGGHGVHPYDSNTCCDDAATTFLTTGERPPRDLSCAAEPAS